MSVDAERERLVFLVRVVRKEARHLRYTDSGLFDRPLDVACVQALAKDDALAERVDAFVSRFSRLQDTLGDKLLPALLRYAGEVPRTAMENLDRGEKLGWIESSDAWLAVRRLRNRMVHEYV